MSARRTAGDARPRGDRTLSLLATMRASWRGALTGVYRPRKPANDNDAALMRWIDELFTGAWPLSRFAPDDGDAAREGVFVEPEARPAADASDGGSRRSGRDAEKASKPAHGHKIYPYLLRNLTIERANHVWAADITYIPIGRGFLYLVAIIDWASRAVLGWRLSNTMDVSFCLGGARGGAGEVRQAGDFQHRPRRAVHFGRLHRRALRRRGHRRSPWTAEAAGWTTCSSSWLWRSPQVRGRLSQELRRWPTRSRARGIR